MIRAFINVFRVPDLRNKVLFTIGMLILYRVGFYVPLPGVNQEQLATHFANVGGGAASRMADMFAMFSGGALGQSTIFGLGIMPYISASIILQILASASIVPALTKLQREGEGGRRKIMEYTRYGTVGLCLIQAVAWLFYLNKNGLVYPDYAGSLSFALMVITGLTAGTVLLMWLGEQIDEYGIGNGISLIIMAGIVVKLPSVLFEIWNGLNFGGRVSGGNMDASKVLFLAVSFVAVIAGSILITQAQRRIPIQQARQARGRRVVGGARHYLPLRVNHGGVMPIIFASSFLLLPNWVFSTLWRNNIPPASLWRWIDDAFLPGSFTYVLVYVAMIYVFSYFWVSVQFDPKQLSNNLRDMGSFIPGLRPGKRTEDYLENVMERITYVGAGFLAVIAVIPAVVATQMNIDFRISSFLGGTGLLIVVSVGLDLIQRLEANLVMRNYEGFLGGDGPRGPGGGGGARIKSGR